MLQSTGIILRTVTHAPLTTKGSQLTWSELDNNQAKIYDDLKMLQGVNGGLVPAYSGATAYNPGQFVSMAVDGTSGIWQQVSGSPSTGVAPGENPLVWTEVQSSDLSHYPGTDQFLDEGGLNEVSAEDLKELLNNSGSGVKTLKANLTQPGTPVGPTIKPLINTFGATITSSYVGLGIYTLDFPVGSFPDPGKVYIMINCSQVVGDVFSAVWGGTNKIEIKHQYLGLLADDFGDNSIEVTVHP
jgi:hypothetical protein